MRVFARLHSVLSNGCVSHSATNKIEYIRRTVVMTDKITRVSCREKMRGKYFTTFYAKL
jgi:hypothetical protein